MEMLLDGCLRHEGFTRMTAIICRIESQEGEGPMQGKRLRQEQEQSNCGSNNKGRRKGGLRLVQIGAPLNWWAAKLGTLNSYSPSPSFSRPIPKIIFLFFVIGVSLPTSPCPPKYLRHPQSPLQLLTPLPSTPPTALHPPPAPP